MNIDQLVARVNSQIEDSRKLKHTDNELALTADDQLKILTRDLAQTVKDFHNFTIGLKQADATQIFFQTWEWSLPSWVSRVTELYRRIVTATTETSFSPYRWSAVGTAMLGANLAKSDPDRRSGWTWEGQRTLRLWNFPQALDLTAEIVKQPPPVFKAVLTKAFADGTGAYLPTTLALGDTYLEEGIYINAEVMCTGTTSATSTNLGETRRVIYSQSNTIDTGVRYTSLIFDRPWLTTLAVGDTIQTTVPMPTEWERLLQCMMIRALAVKKGNLDLQKAVAPELQTEMSRFFSWAGTPKDLGTPHWKTSRIGRQGQYDKDRLNPPRFQLW